MKDLESHLLSNAKAKGHALFNYKKRSQKRKGAAQQSFTGT